MQRYWSSLRYSFLRTVFVGCRSFVVIQLQTSASPRARLTTPIYENPSRRLAISQRAACIQACAADRRAVTHPPLRQTAQALLRNWQHQLWRPRWPPLAPPRGGPLRRGSSPPTPRPLNRGRQEQTAWQLRQQPPGLAPWQRPQAARPTVARPQPLCPLAAQTRQQPPEQLRQQRQQPPGLAPWQRPRAARPTVARPQPLRALAAQTRQQPPEQLRQQRPQAASSSTPPSRARAARVTRDVGHAHDVYAGPINGSSYTATVSTTANKGSARRAFAARRQTPATPTRAQAARRRAGGPGVDVTRHKTISAAGGEPPAVGGVALGARCWAPRRYLRLCPPALPPFRWLTSRARRSRRYKHAGFGYRTCWAQRNIAFTHTAHRAAAARAAAMAGTALETGARCLRR